MKHTQITADIFKFWIKLFDTLVFADNSGWLACKQFIFFVISVKLIKFIIFNFFSDSLSDWL